MATTAKMIAAGGLPVGYSTMQARVGGFVNVVSTATQGNNADTTDDVLYVFAIPALALDADGKQAALNACGKFAANGNNKRFKVWASSSAQAAGSALVATGSTLLLDSGVVTTNGGGWAAELTVVKEGAAGANTQQAVMQQAMSGSTHLGTSAPVALTLAENAPIYLVVTGASPTTGAANDVVLNFAEVWFNQ